MTIHARCSVLALWGVVLLGAGVASAGIAETKHNLSATGLGAVRSTSETEICIFCHTPHQASTEVPYLWNRQSSTANYTTYESSTLYATVGQPTGASKLCLSCHDGTIALGGVLSRPTEIPFAGGIRFLPEGRSRLGTDLADDHPVSFEYEEGAASSALGGGRYDAARSVRRGTSSISPRELKSPRSLQSEVRLDSSGSMQCTTCHDPHDDTFGQFLVMANDFSELCTSCHVPQDWASSAHAVSGAGWNGTEPNPWPHTALSTVAANGCENCHTPHDAGGPVRLLNYLAEEDNCLVCHNGNVASTDIETELVKPYRHGVQSYTAIHDPTESPAGPMATHVECVDCHHPHRVQGATVAPPGVPGVSAGVSGVTSSGSPIQEVIFAYEVCFKCHGDNHMNTLAEVTRQLPQLNTRLEFDITSPSYHPVETPGRNPNVPSLLPPYTVNSLIYCTHCHNSGGDIRGPHGSEFRFLLDDNYTTTDQTQESSFEYALCYKCHDRGSILDDDSFSEHSRHIVEERAPCSVCHDPHGISPIQGNATNNSHLINFDVNVVFPNEDGDVFFEDLGANTGRCSLTCHGEDHDLEDYP